MADEQKKWYVLRAISGKEQNVKEYIELDMKNHGYQEYVSQVLIPQENVVKVQNNKRVEQKRNLLPGYVLVEANLFGEIPHMLRNTPGVLGFLGGTDKPIPLRKKEVERMLGVDEVSEETSVVQTPLVDFLVGEAVKVTDGAFEGFDGCGGSQRDLHRRHRRDDYAGWRGHRHGHRHRRHQGDDRRPERWRHDLHEEGHWRCLADRRRWHA